MYMVMPVGRKDQTNDGEGKWNHFLVLTLNYLAHEGLTHYSGSIRVNYTYLILVSELTGERGWYPTRRIPA